MLDKICVRAHDYGKSDFLRLLAEIEGDGWQGIHLAFTKCVQEIASFSDIKNDHINIVNQSGLAVPVLGSYVELGLVDERLRNAEVQKFIHNIDIACQVNAGCIASETTALAKQPSASKRDALRALYQSLSTIIPIAEERKIVVGIEPVYYHTLSSPALAKALVTDMQSKYLKIVFDPVNLLSFDKVHTQAALWNECMDAFGDNIAAVHLKGVRFEGERPVSCTLRQSQLDTVRLFDMLRSLSYSCALIREEANRAFAAQDIDYMRCLICHK